MKNILLILLCLSVLFTKAQLIQNVTCFNNNKITLGYDTLESTNIMPQKIISFDSISLNTQYLEFYNMCKTHMYNMTNFIIQYSKKQSFTQPRIILNNNSNMIILNISELTISENTKYINFINKIKSKL